MIKQTLSAIALSIAAASSFAMTAVDDGALSQVTGQDGVTIGGDLNVKIGSFTWTDTDATGGSVSFNDISIKGMFVATIDVLNRDTFVSAVGAGMTARLLANGVAAGDVAGLVSTNLTNLVTYGVYDNASDVVQFAFPNANLDTRLTPTIKIASITNGNSTKSYGSLEIKNLDLQGTKIWLYAH